jgi:hypothetical protein
MRKSILLEDAEVGMVVAKAIANDRGMTLCAERTPLTEDLIERFRDMEIDSIYIESNKEMTQEEYLALKQKIEKRFSTSSDSKSLLGKLKTVLLERLESQKG